MSSRKDDAPGGRLPKKTKCEFAFGEDEVGFYLSSQFIMDKLWVAGVRPSCLDQREARPGDDVVILPRRRRR